MKILLSLLLSLSLCLSASAGLQGNAPTLTQAQKAFVCAAAVQRHLFSVLKDQFEQHALLLPLSGTNALGFTRAQMLSGLGSDAAEFTAAQKRLLQMIADLMPSFPGDVWAAQANIRPWFATLTVTIPAGF